MDAETEKKIQELQILEQNFQNLLLQKQAFQIEFNEAKTAFEEVDKAKGDVFRVLGQIMLKSEKNSLKKELQERKEIFQLRINAIEKQETSFRENIERLRSDVMSKIE